MTRIRGIAADRVYRAAGRFVDRALRRNVGVFVASRRAWSAEPLVALQERLAATPARGTFADQWEKVTQGLDDLALQASAELMYVHLLFPDDLRWATKRALVTAPLRRQEDPRRMPAQLDVALDGGIAGTGVAFRLRRRSQLALLADAALSWKRAPASFRQAALADPRVFGGWVATIPSAGADAQRAALSHLVHPDYFEPIVSRSVKERIVAAHADLIPDGVDDVDAALATIRAALTPEYGEGFAFLDLPGAERWR